MSKKAAFAKGVKTKTLPPELAQQGGLTPKQAKADQEYRDKNFARVGAKLDYNRQRLNHARAGITIYSNALSQLIAAAGKRPKPEVRRNINITAHNLADSLFHHGEIQKAIDTLSTIDPKSPILQFYRECLEAIARPDDEHCACDPREKRRVVDIYVPKRAKWVTLIGCACGHMNCSETLPEDFLKLERAAAHVQKRRINERRPDLNDEVVHSHLKAS